MGFVIFTGKETRVALNHKEVKTKASSTRSGRVDQVLLYLHSCACRFSRCRHAAYGVDFVGQQRTALTS